MFKVIVAGSRGFNDYEFLKEKLDHLLQNKSRVMIISGTARGADRLGERYAKEKGHTLLRMAAEWGKYGRSAGYRRNEAMAEKGDALVAFRLNMSKGTTHMINIAKERGLRVRVYDF